MSKTAQRKRQAYEEGLRDGSVGNGVRYSYHPFMDSYRAGYRESFSMRQPRTLLQWLRELFA